MAPNALHLRLAREIVNQVRLADLPAGHHLTELALARSLGTSRSPVKVALAHLADLAVVTHDPNRGYFLATPARELGDLAGRLAPVADGGLFERIADGRLTGALPDVVSEAELMRRYGQSRSAVRKVLERILQEGWVERRPGHGWEFQPIIDSVRAYQESYLFRQAIEPAGILSPTFEPDPEHMAACRRLQERIRDGGHRTMTVVELFEGHAGFHETIADWSGNRFIAQSVRRLNQLRRLVEYRQGADRARVHAQAVEHLEILGLLEQGERDRAADLMRRHIAGAGRRKVRSRNLPPGWAAGMAPDQAGEG